ncbi:hypothetical protein VP01_4624g1, partial [Puccinia sorghi]
DPPQRVFQVARKSMGIFCDSVANTHKKTQAKPTCPVSNPFAIVHCLQVMPISILTSPTTLPESSLALRQPTQIFPHPHLNQNSITIIRALTSCLLARFNSHASMHIFHKTHWIALRSVGKPNRPEMYIMSVLLGMNSQGQPTINDFQTWLSNIGPSQKIIVFCTNMPLPPPMTPPQILTSCYTDGFKEKAACEKSSKRIKQVSLVLSQPKIKLSNHLVDNFVALSFPPNIVQIFMDPRCTSKTEEENQEKFLHMYLPWQSQELTNASNLLS